MTRLALALSLIAAPALAQDRHEWTLRGITSYAQIHAPTADGAVASITFHDEPVHTGQDAFTLTRDGLTIGARIEHMGAITGERLHITVPEGYIVWPDVLQPGEGETGVAHVYPVGLAS